MLWGRGSAIPATRLVGPSGRVDSVDLSSPLDDAVTRSGAELSQLSAHHADVTAWTRLHDRIDGEDGGRPYDLVQSVLGIFFLPEIAAGTEHLIRLLRPGGRRTHDLAARVDGGVACAHPRRRA